MKIKETEDFNRRIAPLSDRAKRIACELTDLDASEIRDVAYAAVGQNYHLGFLRSDETVSDLWERMSRKNGLHSMLPEFGILQGSEQPLFDTFEIKDNNFEPTIVEDLFTNPKMFSDGTPKTNKDCNLTISGQLGYPLEFDIRALDLRFEKFSDPEDVRKFLSSVTVTWFYGEGIPELRVAASAFNPAHRHTSQDRLVIQRENRLIEKGLWPIYSHSVRKRTIYSTESFRMEIQFSGVKFSGPMRVKALMSGKLWCQR